MDKKVVMGKIEDLRETNSEIKADLKTGDGRLMNLDIGSKAKWSWVRKNLASTQKGYSEVSKRAKETSIEDVMVEEYKRLQDQRELQYIIEGKKIVAVATKKHAVSDPDKVNEIITKVLEEKGLKDEKVESVHGRVSIIEETKIEGIIQMGVQIYPGDIKTHNAVKVLPFSRAKSCMNPLSWLNLKKKVVSFRGEIKARRFSAKNFDEELKKKISAGIDEVDKQFSTIRQSIERASGREVSYGKARRILTAMAGSYGLGKKVIDAVMERFEERDGNTLWDLVMAASWVSNNSDRFLKKATNARQKVSTIAGSLVLVDDLDRAADSAKEYVTNNQYARDLWDRVIEND